MYSSPIPLVFKGLFHPEIQTDSPRAGALNKGGVGKTSHFSRFMHQYLENSTRYVQNYYYWLIGIAHALLISANINDIWWTWTAISSNFLRILYDITNLEGNNGIKEQQINFQQFSSIVLSFVLNISSKELLKNLYDIFLTVNSAKPFKWRTEYWA